MNGISAHALALSLARGLRSLLVAGVIMLPLAAGPAQAQIAQVWRSGDPVPASGPVRSGDSYEVMRSVRVQPGSPERHETVSDLFIVQEGTGDVRVGGALLGAKQIRPGEWYGGRIEGGEVHSLAPGDMLWIPANTPHQTTPSSGRFAYVVVKMTKTLPK